MEIFYFRENILISLFYVESNAVSRKEYTGSHQKVFGPNIIVSNGKPRKFRFLNYLLTYLKSASNYKNILSIIHVELE